MYLSQAFYKLQQRQARLQRSADSAGINVDPGLNIELFELNDLIEVIQKFVDCDTSLTTPEWIDAYNTMISLLGIDEEIELDEEE